MLEVFEYLDPVVQSIVSLMSLLVAKMFTVLGKYNIQVTGIFDEKMRVAKANSHFFIKNISVYAIFNDQRFNDMLTNDIVSFE